MIVIIIIAMITIIIIINIKIKKIQSDYKICKNTQLKIKPIKLGKRSETTYCLGCKDYKHNFRP